MKVIKFGAIWCPGCLVMRPRWGKIEKENPWLESLYFDFDNDKEMVSKYKVDDVLPVCIILNDDGDELLRLQGEIDEKKIIKIISKYKDK